MVKKNWQMPQVMELGLNQTKCETAIGDAVTLDGEKIIYGCPYCVARFITKKDRENHIKICHPGGLPTDDMSVGGEGEVPTFS